MKSEVSISLQGTHRGTVIVNGVDIANAVRAFTVRHEVGYPTEVELELVMVNVTTFDQKEAQYLLTKATRDALMAMGWTPPVDEE